MSERSPAPLPVIAVAAGDPAGIGPEIAVKAACAEEVRSVCRPLVVGQEEVVRHYLDRLAGGVRLRRVGDPAEATDDPGVLHVIAVEDPPLGRWVPGAVDAACGRAALAYARVAIALALAGRVQAVAAAPHNQTAIRAAGIAFDGYPGFVARETGADPERVFLMLANDERRIVHVTLHVGVREALRLVRKDRVRAAIEATAATLCRLGVEAPRIAVSGLNPHAGEGGLFGREEIEEIAPAVAEARRRGIDAHGPFGADTMLLERGFDAFVVMLHDQGHIPAKLAAFASTSAMPAGVPVLFASVAHGSAFDIAGRGVADARALIRTITRLAGI